jgi:hypothetical protein
MMIASEVRKAEWDLRCREPSLEKSSHQESGFWHLDRNGTPHDDKKSTEEN